MTRQLLNRCLMIPSEKNTPAKKRKQTISQILREAYSRHCRDRTTRSALRQHLKK